MINFFIGEDGLILGIINNIMDILLIAFGAIVGANTRFFIYKKLEKINLRGDFIIFLINTFSSFSLGLLLSIFYQMSSISYSYQLGLFFSIGLLGSLSTFSTFIYDLYYFSIQSKFYSAFKLFCISTIFGVLFFSVGFLLGS